MSHITRTTHLQVLIDTVFKLKKYLSVTDPVFIKCNYDIIFSNFCKLKSLLTMIDWSYDDNEFITQLHKKGIKITLSFFINELLNIGILPNILEIKDLMCDEDKGKGIFTDLIANVAEISVGIGRRKNDEESEEYMKYQLATNIFINEKYEQFVKQHNELKETRPYVW